MGLADRAADHVIVRQRVAGAFILAPHNVVGRVHLMVAVVVAWKIGLWNGGVIYHHTREYRACKLKSAVEVLVCSGQPYLK